MTESVPPYTEPRMTVSDELCISSIGEDILFLCRGETYSSIPLIQSRWPKPLQWISPCKRDGFDEDQKQHHLVELSYETFVSKQNGYSNLQNKPYYTKKTQLKFLLNFKPITNKWKSEWSLTSATALIPDEKGRRQFWTLYSIVERGATMLLFSCTSTMQHHVGMPSTLYSSISENSWRRILMFVVAKGTRGVDRTTWVGKQTCVIRIASAFASTFCKVQYLDWHGGISFFLLLQHGFLNLILNRGRKSIAKTRFQFHFKA